MADIFERFNKFNPYVTINRDIIEAQNNKTSDIDHPYNLVEWIISTSEVFGTPDEYIKNHTIYVREWYKTKNRVRSVARGTVVNEYVKFLKEVLIVHNNQEEARYLMNIDWTDTYDMDIAVPYFANRLRAVVLYIVEQREKIKFEKIRNSYRGSSTGVTKYVYDQIIDLLGSEKYYLKYGSSLPDIKSAAKDLTVTLSEKYSTVQTVPNTTIHDLDYNVYSDFDKVVEKILDQFPTILTESGEQLEEGGSNLEPVLESDASDISRLSPDYFYNYTGDRTTLNLHLHKLWLEKYSNTTKYYLSAGDTPDDYILDTLYTPNYRLYNHSNTGLPGVSYSLPTETSKPIEHVGGFFKQTGISHAYSLDVSYTVDTLSMSAGETHFFSKPKYYKARSTGIHQHEDVSYIKADASNDALHGDIIDAEQFQKFYPYQSMDESNKYPKFGISKNTDNFDFWKGDAKDVWSNSDIYPVKLTYNYKEPTDQRIKDLLLGSKCVASWRTDIFGNDYALLKESIRPKIHADPESPPGNPCRVLDAEFFWDDTTFQRPPYTDNVDGAPSFRCYDLKLYTDYAYGGYFSPYHCTEFVCFEPNHVEYPDCPEPFVLSGHKATNDPEILEYWLEKFTGKGLEESPSTSNLKVIFDTWNRTAGHRFYETGYYTGTKREQPADDWYWDEILESPVQPKNANYSGFMSPKAQWRTKYTHDAVLQSFDSDDDSIFLVAAYVYTHDPSGDPAVESTYRQIVACRNRGGMGPDRWYLALRESGVTVTRFTPTDPGWAPETDRNWSGCTVAVHVERDGNIIRATTSSIGPNTATKMTDHTLDPTSLIEIDLTSDPAFADFLGPTGIGYACESQAESFFNDASAFKQAAPSTPIGFDIYDFTQCKPKILKYDLGQNIWNTYQSDDFDAKVAGDGVLVVDKDGCGSYGFDCLGRCLTVSTTADCGPPPPPLPPQPDPTFATGPLTYTDYFYTWAAYPGGYLDYWEAQGLDKQVVAAPEELYLPWDMFENHIFRENIPFPLSMGILAGAYAPGDPNPGTPNRDFYGQTLSGNFPGGIYSATLDTSMNPLGSRSVFDAYSEYIIDYPTLPPIYSTMHTTSGPTMDAFIVKDGFVYEIYEDPDFGGNMHSYEGPVIMCPFGRAGGGSYPTNFGDPDLPPIGNCAPGRPGFSIMGVFVRQFKDYINTESSRWKARWFQNSAEAKDFPIGFFDIDIDLPTGFDPMTIKHPAEWTLYLNRRMFTWFKTVDKTVWDEYDKSAIVFSRSPMNLTNKMRSFKIIKK